MFWFVSAVVLTMIAIIDLATNLHVLLLRHLARHRAARRGSCEPLLRHPAMDIDPTLDLDTDTLLRELHGVSAA